MAKTENLEEMISWDNIIITWNSLVVIEWKHFDYVCWEENMKDRKVRMENLVSTKAHQKPSTQTRRKVRESMDVKRISILPFYYYFILLNFCFSISNKG